MKIAQIVSVFPSYPGGIGRNVYHIAWELSQRGHQVVVFTPFYKKIFPPERVNFILVRLKPILKYGKAAILPQLLWQLKDFDLVHLHYPFFGSSELIWLWKKMKPKSKLVVTYHMDTMGQGILAKFFAWHNKYIMPKIIQRADKILVSSFDYVEDSNIKKFLKDFPQKFSEVPMGVDTDFFKPQDKDKNFLRRHNLGYDDKIILFVGALDKAHYFKGVDVLLRASHKIKTLSYKLIIVGEGELKSHYIKLTQELELEQKVIFTGFVLDKDLPQYYNLADLVILPSIDKSEAFGLVLLEAMASAKPIMASNLRGVRTLVGNGRSGFLIKPKDPDDLAEKIKDLLENDKLRAELGQAGRRKVEEKYSWQKIGQELENIFLKLLK